MNGIKRTKIPRPLKYPSVRLKCWVNQIKSDPADLTRLTDVICNSLSEKGKKRKERTDIKNLNKN